MNKPILVDTCVLLDYPQIIQQEENIIIATDTLRELDGLKLNVNSEVAFKARRAAVVISRNLDKLKWNSTYENEKIAVDDKLLKVAVMEDAVLITNDVYLKVKANIQNIDNRGYGGTEIYTGVRYLNLDFDENGYNKEFDDLLSGKTKLPDIRENEYVIIRNKNNKVLDKYTQKEQYETNCNCVYRNGELRVLQKQGFKNKYVGKVTPKNDEQICLFDALTTSSSSILYAGGSFGVGKSYLLNNYALWQLEQGNIRKIVYVPNNAFAANTIDIGSLPGDVLSKTVGQIGPLVDLIGIDQINRKLEEEELEVVPMGFMRGRNFTDSIIIVNEAQNLTEDHIKLLIGRCGQGSRIFFDGDLKQTDSEIFKNKSGLKLLLHLSESPEFSKIFSTVRLQSVERSITARAADYLDNLLGNI